MNEPNAVVINEVKPGARIDRVYRLVMQPHPGMPMLVNKQDRKFVRNPIRGNVREMVTFA